MIKSDEEILTFEDLLRGLGLTGPQLNSLIKNGLPFVSLGDKRVFLAASIKYYFARIEEKKR